MAADPGSSGGSGPPYHLFLTRIPPKLPKEEAEAALSAELASRDIKVLVISVVPQSAWKNKGFGFVILDGCPTDLEVNAIAEELDNSIRVGGKAVNVRVCQASVSGGKPAVAPGPLTSWDQPTVKITRLCAQVLHCYFARRTHQESFKAEKLIALLSKSVAPSCCQEPKPVSLWGRDVYGSLEKMLLAIGESHFGGGWSLSGTIAERSAMLSIGKARHMQGWDSVRDPLPITTLLRLAACQQRLKGNHTPHVGSGFSTPTVCRRCSDCGSLSAMHSTEQPSCSQSEASWSLGSLYAAPATAGDQTASDCSPSSLCTPITGNDNDAEGAALSSATSTSPGSWGSCKSLESCGGSGDGSSGGASGSRNGNGSGVAVAASREGAQQGGASGATQSPESSGTTVTAAGAGDGAGAGTALEAAAALRLPRSPPAGERSAVAQPGAGAGAGGADADGDAGQRGGDASGCGAAASTNTVSCPGASARSVAATPTCRGGLASAAGAATFPQRLRHRPSRSQQLSGGSCGGSRLSPGPGFAPAPAAHPQGPQAGSCQQLPGGGETPQPPSARDLLARCARRLRSLFRRQPAQLSYAVADVASYLSEAEEVVAWGRDAAFFSLEGYACAVYGSLESFLLKISRLHFNDSWCFSGGHRPGEPRIMFRNRRTAAGALLAPV